MSSCESRDSLMVDILHVGLSQIRFHLLRWSPFHQWTPFAVFTVLPTSGTADFLSEMPTIFQKECLNNLSMTQRVIEHCRTLHHLQNIHYYLYSSSLMIQLKMTKETIILRDIPIFHLGCHGMSDSCGIRSPSLTTQESQETHEEWDSDRHANIDQQKFRKIPGKLLRNELGDSVVSWCFSWEVIRLANPLASPCEEFGDDGPGSNLEEPTFWIGFLDRKISIIEITAKSYQLPGYLFWWCWEKMVKFMLILLWDFSLKTCYIADLLENLPTVSLLFPSISLKGCWFGLSATDRAHIHEEGGGFFMIWSTTATIYQDMHVGWWSDVFFYMSFSNWTLGKHQPELDSKKKYVDKRWDSQTNLEVGKCCMWHKYSEPVLALLSFMLKYPRKHRSKYNFFQNLQLEIPGFSGYKFDGEMNGNVAFGDVFQVDPVVFWT